MHLLGFTGFGGRHVKKRFSLLIDGRNGRSGTTRPKDLGTTRPGIGQRGGQVRHTFLFTRTPTNQGIPLQHGRSLPEGPMGGACSSSNNSASCLDSDMKMLLPNTSISSSLGKRQNKLLSCAEKGRIRQNKAE